MALVKVKLCKLYKNRANRAQVFETMEENPSQLQMFFLKN